MKKIKNKAFCHVITAEILEEIFESLWGGLSGYVFDVIFFLCLQLYLCTQGRSGPQHIGYEEVL